MKKSIVVIMILVGTLSCNNEVDYSARDINWDRDICVTCLMGLAEQEYSVQAINPEGKVIWFDDLGCLIEYMDYPEWEKFNGDESKIWIGECDHGGWIDAHEAYYRYGDKTPMGYGYGAMKQANDSSFDFNTTIQRIKDGITMREAFLKAKGMSVSND
ncbi:MAG: hypothetical protein U9N53_01245 [Bacteroidota bacterium]|nr:hypothetical protein [Bacteroidota bacterium]